MTEPRRWLDDARTHADLRRILETRVEPPPLPRELHTQLSAFAATLASQSLLVKVGGGSLWSKLLLWGSSSGKVLLLLSAVGAAGAGAYAVHERAASTRVLTRTIAPSSRTHVPVASSRSVAAPKPAVAGSKPRVDLAPAVAAPGGGRLSTRIGSGASTEPVGSPAAASFEAGASIAQEAKLLESARGFLGDSPALSLELTERHRSLYPQGQLVAEREFIAIDALVRLGRRQEAEERAAPRLAQSPASVYARRLRRLLGASGAIGPKNENH